MNYLFGASALPFRSPADVDQTQHLAPLRRANTCAEARRMPPPGAAGHRGGAYRYVFSAARLLAPAISAREFQRFWRAAPFTYAALDTMFLFFPHQQLPHAAHARHGRQGYVGAHEIRRS